MDSVDSVLPYLSDISPLPVGDFSRVRQFSTLSPRLLADAWQSLTPVSSNLNCWPLLASTGRPTALRRRRRRRAAARSWLEARAMTGPADRVAPQEEEPIADMVFDPLREDGGFFTERRDGGGSPEFRNGDGMMLNWWTSDWYLDGGRFFFAWG